MTVSLSPVARQQFWQNGVVAAGGLLFTYAAGTSTKQTTYTDSTGATPNTNPIVLDANGQCELFLNPALNYKYTLSPSTDTDPPSNPYWTVDNIAPTASYAGGLPQYLPQENQTATANQTLFTLASVTYDSTNPTSLQVFVNGLLTESTVDWLATSNTQITFTNALTAGDLVTFISSYIVGLRGPSGTNGTNGTNGASAYTTTAASFTQPSIGNTVSAQVGATAWMAQGQILYITGGGYYTLTTITDGTHVVLTNLGYAGNVSPSSTVPSGAAVTAGGTKGQDGSGTGTVTSVALSLPADLTVSGSPVTTSGTLTGAWATTPTGTGAMVRATAPALAHPTFSDYTLFTTQGTPPSYAAGTLFYETSNDALTFYSGITGNDVHLGQEVQIRAYNQTGSTIPAGSTVYINGQHSQFPTIALAQANSLATSGGFGVANTDIANNSYGYIVTLGKYTGLDTSAFTSGDTLYVSTATAGALTNVAPTSPNFAVKIGVCVYSNPSQGVIYVSDGPVYVNASAVIGQIAIANGGTGASTAATARSNLGAAASGSNSDITALSGLTTALSVGQGGTGSTSLAANNVLLGNGTSAFQVVAPGTSGNVLTSNGTTWVSQAAGGGGGAWTKISTRTASSSASLSWTELSGYDRYMLIFEQMVGTTTSYLQVQFGTGAGPTYVTSGYGGQNFTAAGASVTASTYVNQPGALVSGNISTSGTSGGVGEILLVGFLNTANSVQTLGRSHSVGSNENYANEVSIGAVVTAIKLSFASGNISSGSATLYGIN